MSLNMDFTQRVVINSESLDWDPSRLPGVERRKLEREAPESGRATTLVRYAPDSHFSPHTHTGGEEFLVLEGVFSDETGDFGPGCYVRNPIGSTHRPHSDEGCVIFVKLCQFNPKDTEFVRVNTADAPWQPGLADGLSVISLHEFGTEHVALAKWAPGTQFTRHTSLGGEEIFVLDGVFEDEHGRYPKGMWLRNPAGSVHTPFSTEGATLYVKTGHLVPGTGAKGEPEASFATAAS